jgi:anti-sigma regulatory factor (Ser/Thr protein kinase)
MSLSSPLPGTPIPLDAFEGSRMLLPKDETAPRAARLYAKDWATNRVIPHETVSDLLLVVSELATNAVCHGSPPFELTLLYREGVISGAVSDGSLEKPRRVANPDERGGRGLTLVEACTTRWGTAVHDNGKEVWFDIELATPPTAAETS